MFSTADTIVAIATPSGRGGIGVVRISGPDAVRIAQTLLGRGDALVPRHATLARIVESIAASDIRAIDQVVVTWFAAPHSYTGDDVVEISGHGSPVLLQCVVELAMRAGARLAEPGEFTLRAYLNERIDLIQAEAVVDLVDAVTPLQARAAMDQLEGTLTSAIAQIDAGLFDLSARLEASLDFPEEGFHFITRDQAVQELERIAEDIAALVRQGKTGRIVREGRMVVIAGRPNAGKSSLFNALVGSARAIVTEIPGTTRDMLTERVDVGGVPITLVDTAGLRATTDTIELEGVERARQVQRVAGLTLAIVDGSAPLEADDRELLSDLAASPHIVVISKVDLPRAWSMDQVAGRDSHGSVIEASALTGEGLNSLRAKIVEVLVGRAELRDPPRVSNARHLSLLEEALVAVERGSQALVAGATEELVLADMSAARQTLEEITGRRAPDDLLRHIFSRFCIGK